jgi:hypothetical protein
VFHPLSCKFCNQSSISDINSIGVGVDMWYLSSYRNTLFPCNIIWKILPCNSERVYRQWLTDHIPEFQILLCNMPSQAKYLLATETVTCFGIYYQFHFTSIINLYIFITKNYTYRNLFCNIKHIL